MTTDTHPKPDPELSKCEQAHVLSDPTCIASLMVYHAVQQDQADSMGAECTGNQRRYEELQALGRDIVSRDPDIWPDSVRADFGFARSSSIPAGDVGKVVEALDLLIRGFSTCPLRPLFTVHTSQEMDEWWMKRTADNAAWVADVARSALASLRGAALLPQMTTDMNSETEKPQ